EVLLSKPRSRFTFLPVVVTSSEFFFFAVLVSPPVSFTTNTMMASTAISTMGTQRLFMAVKIGKKASYWELGKEVKDGFKRKRGERVKEICCVTSRPWIFPEVSGGQSS